MKAIFLVYFIKDAVCDRDFIAEFMFWCSMTLVHFSQLSEDLIIYNTLVKLRLIQTTKQIYIIYVFFN